MKAKCFFTFIRVSLGLVYLISGTEKLLGPSENFLYIIQGYDMIPLPIVEKMMSLTFPWLEFFLGGFLVLGLWTRESLIALGTFSVMFIIALGQAIVRKLPLSDCGCFGDLVGMPLEVTFMIDVGTLSLAILLLYLHGRGVDGWAVDHFWKERKDV
jgi:triosephosphate isomerase